MSFAEVTTLAVQEPATLGVPSWPEHYLALIRPEVRATQLVQRVLALLPVDPGSACQKLLNAAMHDLKKKVVVAGLDIAQQVAADNKLPPLAKADDVEEYSTTNVLELAYRMGIVVNKADWQRLQIAYRIRGQLEHEDDEYIANIGDVAYIFSACVELVLAREPFELLGVQDVRQAVEAAGPVELTPDAIEDYGRAPEVRQREIGTYLINTALNDKGSDLVPANAVQALRTFAPFTKDAVKIEQAGAMYDRAKRRPLTSAHLKVALAGGCTPYMKRGLVRGFYKTLRDELEAAGYGWRLGAAHGPHLKTLEDLGGLVLSAAVIDHESA